MALADWAPLEPDPYEHCHVTIPGLFWEGDGGRETIHGTSYHDVAIRLACGLYESLASTWLEYAKVDPSSHFDDSGTICWSDVPGYRDFPEKEWPAEFADKVMEVARAVNPTIDAGLLATELKLENSRALRQLARMSESDTTGANENVSPSARPAATPPDPYDELASFARREFVGKSLATVLEVCEARGEIELAKLNRLLNGLSPPRGWTSLDKAERGVKDVIIGIKSKLLKMTTPGWVLSQKNDKVYLVRQEPSPPRS